MNEPRCDKTDLLVSQCSHCLGLDEKPKFRAISRFIAKYHGWCVGCGAGIAPGDKAAYDSDGDLICGECAL